MSLASNKTNSFVVSKKKYTISIILELVVTLNIDTTLNINRLTVDSIFGFNF